MKQRIFSHLVMAAALVMLAACSKNDRTVTDVPEPEQTTGSYALPVVFHVLYANEYDATQKVPASRLAEVLNNVNALYHRQYGEGERLNIRFVLATTDEQGRKLNTPGVNYIKMSNAEYPIDPYALMNDRSDKYKAYMWDPNRYINIYVYHFKQQQLGGTTLGISHMALSSKNNSPLEGLIEVPLRYVTKDNLPGPYCVSINSVYVDYESNRYKEGANTPRLSISAADFNVTLAHELGHYLGLFHVFGEEDNEAFDGFKDSDYCKDTPTYNKVAYDKFLAEYLETHSQNNARLDDVLKRTASDGSSFVSTNIMDYAFSMGNAFTADQAKRMYHVVEHSPLMPRSTQTKANSTRAGEEHKGVMDIKFVVVE